ncbi:MAG TPA: ABC transporter permease subunit [Anaerolineaceae bacterium]|nr:ABC transporter permease subunit [Anaerolineaceae bacterium]
MEKQNETKAPAPQAVPNWQLDLDKVGLVRRMLLARKWYGGDWWFVLISAIILLFVITVGVFPEWFAPYDPRAEVGPSLLAPGEPPVGYSLVVRTNSGYTSLQQISSSKNNIGYLIGSPASQALRDQVKQLNDAAVAEGKPATYQPRSRRYEDIKLGLADVANGTIDAFVTSPDELGDLLAQYPDLWVGSGLTEGGGKGFILGTNQIGQDVLSRIIWGTRIALIVGLASAIIAFLIGVPLGLISGFVSGPLDRILTLLMDSLYSFPGLILAISIAAVLGPGIGNIIISIAALYIPTYFRIVRGQTLSVKQELYVDAAKSLGSTSWTILRKYIFPNVIPSVVIIFSVNVADAILTEAGLSFIGLGLPPDTPDWGIDLARGQDYLRRAWWLITFPGIAVSLVTLAFSMLGESLSEILNPRLAEL